MLPQLPKVLIAIIVFYFIILGAQLLSEIFYKKRPAREVFQRESIKRTASEVLIRYTVFIIIAIIWALLGLPTGGQ